MEPVDPAAGQPVVGVHLRERPAGGIRGRAASASRQTCARRVNSDRQSLAIAGALAASPIATDKPATATLDRPFVTTHNH